jgi:hypothetical protein
MRESIQLCLEDLRASVLEVLRLPSISRKLGEIDTYGIHLGLRCEQG